jgi:hypothetical protein
MPISKIPKYLDDSLLELGLHTEARTSFITYVSSCHYLFLILLCHLLSWTSPHVTDAFRALRLILTDLMHLNRYWLPDLLHHPNIALRFLPQSSYEKAAPLEVKPQPTLVVRVFMLWRGVSVKDLEHWTEASTRVSEMSCSEWREVVGVPTNFNVDKHRNKDGGFTVLEWGGMEVKV